MNEITSPVCLDQIHIPEYPQMLRDSPSRDAQQIRESAYAERPSGQQLHNSHAGFDGKSFE